MIGGEDVIEKKKRCESVHFKQKMIKDKKSTVNLTCEANCIIERRRDGGWAPSVW